MAEQNIRTLLSLTQLDDRLVPSTVTVSTTDRPLTFVGTGTLTTSAPLTDNGVAVTETTSTTVTLAGQFNYTDNANGQSGTITLTGTGTGNEAPTTGGTTGGIGSFAETTQAQFALQDSNGALSSTTSLTGTTTWLTSSATTGSTPLGTQSLTGTLNVSNDSLLASWGNASTATGTLTATLSPATPAPTTLAFGQSIATLSSDGSVNLGFTVEASGNLMTAASHTTAVTDVVAIWQGGGQTQSTDLNVPIYWNTGQLNIQVSGLTPPSWAKTLTVEIDPGHVVTTSTTPNTTWNITLSSIGPASGISGTPPPTGTGTSPPITGTSPPPTTSPPTTGGTSPPVTTQPPPTVPPPSTVVASYTLLAGPNPAVEFVGASGNVLAVVPAFTGYSGPVTIATDDANGDGVPDVVIAAGTGGGPRVRVLDGKTGAEISDFFAYDPNFRGGVSVAVANVDGTAEIITGAGTGGGPEVGVFDAQTGQMITAFYAYSPSFTGGVNVATADLTGSGSPEIITGTGPGGGPLIAVFDLSGNHLYSAFAGDATMRDGVLVQAGFDATDNAAIVTADVGPGTPLERFRSQLAAGGPPLVELPSDTMPMISAS